MKKEIIGGQCSYSFSFRKSLFVSRGVWGLLGLARLKRRLCQDPELLVLKTCCTKARAKGCFVVRINRITYCILPLMPCIHDLKLQQEQSWSVSLSTSTEGIRSRLDARERNTEQGTCYTLSRQRVIRGPENSTPPSRCGEIAWGALNPVPKQHRGHNGWGFNSDSGLGGQEGCKGLS